MDPANSSDTEPRENLIIRPSSGLVGLPEGRSAPLEEMITRSLDHLSESAGLITPEPRPGEERDFQIAPGVTMRMCWCPAGDFLMGSPESEKPRKRNEAQVRVVLSKGFWMGKTQVTQAQWQALMGNNPSVFQGKNYQKTNHPVECVSWHDAQAFLKIINNRLGTKDGGKMVLPTEAQWEYAARAGQKEMYAGGSLDEVAWCNGLRYPSDLVTHPVGKKKPNAWGLHDMSGNVWEWCQDWYGTLLSGGIDPNGPDSGSKRVHRGGCWLGDTIRTCRVAHRGASNPTESSEFFIGFRVTRSSVPLSDRSGVQKS
jgi:formylglycine-generating enzyme required for sulfatase activity